jgi:predicted DNA-binding transcriptional regulator AlpA
MATLPNSLIHLLNEYEVAEILGVSVATVRRWRLLRLGPQFLKVNGSSVRYNPDSLSAWLASCPTGGGQQKEVQ